MKKNALVLTSLATALFSVNASAATKWDLPTAYPDSNFHTEIAMKFVKAVSDATGGEFKITVHSNASLFKAPEIKRAVQGNQAQAGEILLSNFANEDPIYELDGLPFLATGYEQAWKLYQAQKPYLEKKLESQGMKLLYSVAWPPQGIFTNKTLNSIDDMKGLKWRAYSPVTSKIAQEVGAHPVTIQQAELSQALATGVVDSYMSSGSTGYDTKTYEYLKKLYDTQAWLPKNALIVNKKAFDALDDKERKALLDAAAEAEKTGWALSQEKTKWYNEQLVKNGVEIVKPSSELIAGLTKIGESMIADWTKKAGADGEKLLNDYKSK